MAVIFLIVFFAICFVLIEPTNGNDFILISTPKSLVQYTIEDGPNGELSFSNKAKYELDKFMGLAEIDMKRNCLFWHDHGENYFYRNCPNKTGHQISTPLFPSNRTHSVTYDWMSDTLYFSLHKLRIIKMVKIIDGEDLTRPTLMHRRIIETKSTARKVRVHPKRGYLFWTEFETGTDALISRANLDGTGVRVLFRHPKIYNPNALTVDYDEDRLYWADPYFAYIGSSDLNGRNVGRVCMLEKNLWLDMITVRAGHLLWYNSRNSSHIRYIEKGKTNEL